MKKCFYPTCNLGNPLWEVFFEGSLVPLNQACTEHVGHAIALYECSEEQPVRERYVYLIRKKRE